MRRVVSTILFIFGGWFLTAQIACAFLDFAEGLSDNLLLVGFGTLFAGVPLLLGLWASPGNRWRELGLTILIAVGVTLFAMLSVVVSFMDPAFQRYMPPMPEIGFAPVVGVVNLLVVGATGWWLYRRGQAVTE